MDEIKISASFLIPGATMYKDTTSNGDSVKYKNIFLEVIGNKGKKETVRAKMPKCKPCTQTINMTKEAYINMLNTPANNSSLAFWKKLTIKQRIAEYLKDIQHDLHASSFEFTILED